VPLTAAQTTTEMSAQPASNVAGGLPVHVDLIFDGVSFNAAALRAALDAAYGTVTLETDAARPTGPFRFRISA
jgi:hypothetical protein